MKKVIAVLAATTVLFLGLWIYEITDLSDVEQRCQRYAEASAGGFLNFEEGKNRNEEPLMGDYWGAVSNFYAFMDTLYLLPDKGGWNESAYENCAVIYDHMILAPEEVLAHMEEVVAAMELVGEDFDSPEARNSLSELSYNFRCIWE